MALSPKAMASRDCSVICVDGTDHAQIGLADAALVRST